MVLVYLLVAVMDSGNNHLKKYKLSGKLDYRNFGNKNHRLVLALVVEEWELALVELL